MKLFVAITTFLLLQAPDAIAEKLGMIGDGETKASRQLDVELVDPIVLADSLAATNAFLSALYDRSTKAAWRKFSKLGKDYVDKNKWFASIEDARMKNGARVRSEFIRARRTEDLGTVEKGDYVLIVLRSVYENRVLRETLALSVERRRWRVGSYSFQEIRYRNSE